MKLRLALVAAAITLLGGCPAPGSGPATADADRVAVMRAETILKGTDAHDKPGFIISDKLGPVRSTVTATLSKADTGIDGAREMTAVAIRDLRASGWTVYFVGCKQQEADWVYTAYGYKVSDEISYAARLTGKGFAADQRAYAEIFLIAPNSREPASNLFADKPAGLTGGTCADSPSAPTQGAEIFVDENGPDPDGPAKEPNHR